jgi:hypothetical protein
MNVFADNLRRLSKLAGPAALSAALVLGLAGCRSTEDPGGYSRERPPADRLDDRDSGLQSPDILMAADQMAESLLTLPEVQNTPERLTVVVDRVENLTSTERQNLDIFLERLRIEIARRGRAQIQLITDRAVLRDIQSRELEQPPGDEFGGAGAQQPAPGPAGIQPDYALHAQVSDLPNRGTNFYLFVFTLTDLRSREDVWTDSYDVRVAR